MKKKYFQSKILKALFKLESLYLLLELSHIEPNSQNSVTH